MDYIEILSGRMADFQIRDILQIHVLQLSFFYDALWNDTQLTLLSSNRQIKLYDWKVIAYNYLHMSVLGSGRKTTITLMYIYSFTEKRSVKGTVFFT